MRIRRAREAEAATLTALARRSKGHWGYESSFLDACADELRVTSRMIRENPVWLLEDDRGRLLGHYVLEHEGDEEAELHHLFIEPDAIGMGAGRRLFEHAKEIAVGFGCTRLLVQGDPNAAGFYERIGGDLIGTRPSESIPGRELPLYVYSLED